MNIFLTAVLNIHWSDVIAGGFVGFFVAFFTTAIYELLRKPDLKFEIDKNINIGFRSIKSKDYKWKFINVVVSNKKRPFYKSWLLGNVTAENAKAWVIFKGNNKKLRVSARWASTPQPINDLGHPDWSSILVISRETIPVGEAASLAIALKTDKSSDIFAFNNESYEYYPDYPAPFNTLWSKPEYNIGSKKKYVIEIKLLTFGHEYSDKFLLVNPNSSYDSMKLKKNDNE